MGAKGAPGKTPCRERLQPKLARYCEGRKAWKVRLRKKENRFTLLSSVSCVLPAGSQCHDGHAVGTVVDQDCFRSASRRRHWPSTQNRVRASWASTLDRVRVSRVIVRVSARARARVGVGVRVPVRAWVRVRVRFGFGFGFGLASLVRSSRGGRKARSHPRKPTRHPGDTRRCKET